MKHLLLFLSAFLLLTKAYSQDIPFSMYHDTPMLSNPALIATNNQMELNYHKRVQWKGVGSKFKSTAVSLKYPIIVLKDNKPRRLGGIGFSYLKDVTQSQKASSVQMSLAYNLHIQKNLYLSMATLSGYHQKKLNPKSLITSYDANYNPIYATQVDGKPIRYINLGGSLLLYNEDGYPSNEKKYYLGASMFYLNTPSVSYLDAENELQFRTVFIGGFRALRSSKVSIIPTFRWIEDKTSRQVNVGAQFNHHFSESSGALFRHGKVGLGVAYSFYNAVITSIEFESPTFKAGFSYGFSANDLQNATGYPGVTEFSFSIKKTIGRPKEAKPEYDKIHEDDIDDIEEIDEIDVIEEMED